MGGGFRKTKTSFAAQREGAQDCWRKDHAEPLANYIEPAPKTPTPAELKEFDEKHRAALKEVIERKSDSKSVWAKIASRGFNGHYDDCNGDDSCVCMFVEDLMAEGARLQARDARAIDKLRKAQQHLVNSAELVTSEDSVEESEKENNLAYEEITDALKSLGGEPI